MSVTSGTGAPTVAYVVKRFPRLSETFILNEILELERQGLALEVFSLLPPSEEVRHAALAGLRARVTYLPQNDALSAASVCVGARSAAPVECPLDQAILDSSAPGGALFPGKDAAETAVLLFQAATLAAAAWARNIKHLHAHFATDATTVAMLASGLAGFSYSFTAHAKDIFHTYTDRETDDAFLKRKIRNAEFVVTVSDYNRRHLAKLAEPESAAKILRLYNGIDLQRFRFSSGLHEPGLILAAGRLTEKKGIRYLIEACARLRNAGRSFRCLIVGDGPERERLGRQIAQRALWERVTLAGVQPQEQLLATMHRASVLVVPSVVSASGDRDGLPTVLLEALATGLPVVSTKTAGVSEIIDCNVNGLLVPPNDPGGLANAIAELLDKPALQKRLAEAGRVKAERIFDVRKNVHSLRQLLAASLTSPGNRDVASDERRVHYG